jgi:hypothetical protein
LARRARGDLRGAFAATLTGIEALLNPVPVASPERRGAIPLKQVLSHQALHAPVRGGRQDRELLERLGCAQLLYPLISTAMIHAARPTPCAAAELAILV